MDYGVAEVLSADKTEGREGIVFGSQQELLYRTITVDSMIQSFADGFCYLSD